ncbi:hypothetical protein [Paracoccus suum]|nr:hypothetical protein [Paracoccus suum]
MAPGQGLAALIVRPAAMAVAAACLGGPAAAAGLFVPPAGCELQLTVQERGCSVAQHYQCSADPAGEQHTTYFGKGGVSTFMSHIDAETRWLDSEDPETGVSDRLEPGAADDASLSALLASGKDSFDFWTAGSDGQRLHHVGADRLTGETVTIDGEPLARTSFHLTTSDEAGRVLISREGHQHVSASLRLFFGGQERQKDSTGALQNLDHSPVRFIRSGQPGFASTEPMYDCEILTATLIPLEIAR